MVSIIISFYERIDHLRYCLDSLDFSKKFFDEVIITDDGSSAETVIILKEMISHYNFTIHHVWQPKNGFRVAAARNNGIRYSKGDYLIFFDSDFLILPGTIEHHLQMAESGKFVAGHCKYLSEEQTKSVFNSNISPVSLETLYADLPQKEITKSHRRFIKRTILIRLHMKSSRKQSLGGHFSIFRKDIERVNGYDENFRGWGGEDEDLGIRLVQAGIYGRSAIRYAKILHMWHPREIGTKHWKEGPNIKYFVRENVDFFCKNGLIKK